MIIIYVASTVGARRQYFPSDYITLPDLPASASQLIIYQEQ